MEKILVAGANGKTGREIIKILKGMEDYEPVAMIRKEEQKATFDKLEVKTVLADLEGDLSEAVKGIDRVIFAAGSGGNTPPEKTIAVDQNGAINLIDQAKSAKVKKFVILSSMGADHPSKGPEKLEDYLKAKANADKHLQDSSLKYSIVRPGNLTNDEKTNKIKASEKSVGMGKISRKDVAQVLVSSLAPDRVQNKIFEIISGDTAIDEALKGL